MIYGLLVLLAVLATVFAADLPQLNFGGFSWAENLAFDGLGNLFVTDAVRGEMWRIYLSADGTKYDGEIYLHDGVKKFGGIQVSPDGSKLFAGATFEDDSVGIVTCATSGANGVYSVAAKTETQPNGMVVDWERNIIYYTQEGSVRKTGTLVAVNLNSGSQTVVHEVPGADGAWLDATNHKLYVGELTAMKIMVFDTTGVDVATFIGEYTGLSEALRSTVHMLDDLTLYTTGAENVGETMLLGADWTGKQVVLFRVDGGVNITTISPPEGVDLYEPTSIRWGKGPGFDSSSIYVTEGGGMTSRTTDRRVLQFKMN